MRLNKIVLSGANEHTDIKELLALCNAYPFVEIGIQVSGSKASFGSARYWWLHTLAAHASPKNHLALHLNQDWVEGFCAGKIPPELNTFLNLEHHNGTPVFKRIQLNFKIGREKTPDMSTLLQTIRFYQPKHKFIWSYNESNQAFIEQVYQRRFPIDALLYDSSFGEGIVPNERPAPVFADVYQGYAGGLSPENVEAELQKIQAVVQEHRNIFIDAEGALKGADRHLSLKRCKLFLENATQFCSC